MKIKKQLIIMIIMFSCLYSKSYANFLTTKLENILLYPGNYIYGIYTENNKKFNNAMMLTAKIIQENSSIDQKNDINPDDLAQVENILQEIQSNLSNLWNSWNMINMMESDHVITFNNAANIVLKALKEDDIDSYFKLGIQYMAVGTNSFANIDTAIICFNKVIKKVASLEKEAKELSKMEGKYASLAQEYIYIIEQFKNQRP